MKTGRLCGSIRGNPWPRNESHEVLVRVSDEAERIEGLRRLEDERRVVSLAHAFADRVARLPAPCREGRAESQRGEI
jgi:hypothetical protein